MIRLFGIPNCDTVKKARAWCDQYGVAYEFVDFKKTPPDANQLQQWLAAVPLATLLNKKGTTWRKLDSAQQAQAEHTEGAIALMQAHPSVIKRPVLQCGEQTIVGFSAADEIEKLDRLKAAGSISEQEYKTLRARLVE